MPAPGGHAPSMRDVARRAGVSHQTVSRVINDSPNIRAGTRERVLQAIDDLGYRPNGLARALAHGRSRRIGLLMESSSHYGPMNMLRGVELAARRAGYAATTFSVTSPDEFDQGIDFLRDQRVDALAVITPRQESLESLSRVHLPRATVLVGSLQPDADQPEPGDLPRVGVDQALGARLAVEHLIALGHRTIAHLAGPADWFDAQVRREQWRATLEASGLEAPPVVEGDWRPQSGYDATAEILAIPGVTAVFAANDQMALGLIHGLSDRGLSIPRDLSVVGFDDIPESAHFRPPLTTVHQDFQAVGEAAVAVLLAGLGEDVPPPDARIVPDLVVRGSTAPA